MKLLFLFLLSTSVAFSVAWKKTEVIFSEKEEDALSHILLKTIPKLITSFRAKGKPPGLFNKAVAMIKKNAHNIKEKLNKVKEDESDRINQVIAAVGNGVEGMQEAMSNQDQNKFLLSCLDLVSSLASLTGPQGKIVSDILGMVSGFIRMFQETPKVESQESMIKRVVETAVEDAQVEDLQFEISGTLELYMILADSISNFRSHGNISHEQASEFYNHAFRSLVIFGKLKENMKKYCTDANEEGKSEEEKKKTLNIIERCLAFSSLYCKLSISRHSLLVNMAVLINSDNELDKLTATANNLLHLVRSEQSSNKDTLRFFADPMNHKPYRRVVAEFWQNQYKYPILGAYLQKLNVVFDNSLHNHKVMVCSGFMLSGACKEFSPGLYDGPRMTGWSNSIQSVFIPPGMSVSGVIKGFTTDASSSRDSRMVGPLFGPHVFGVVPGDQQWIRTYKRWIKDVTPNKWYKFLNPFNKLHRKEYEKALRNMRADWDSLLIKTSRNIIASRRIMLCTEKNMGIQGLCQLIEPLAQDSSISYDLKKVYGINLVRTISSMHLPSDVELIAQGDGKTYGPFYGPGVYPEVCGIEKWTVIKLRHVPNEMSSSKKVQICSKEKMKGQCDFLGVGDFAYLDDIHGCDWTKQRISSAKLPYGITVLFYTAVNFYGRELGPFHGPAQFPYVDGYGLDNFAIRSMKILRTDTYEEDQAACPFMGNVGFIFDGYQEEEFLQAKMFLKRMINNFKPSSNSVLASVLYLGDSKIASDMNNGRNEELIKANIDRIVQMKKGKFSLVEGMRHAQKHMFLPKDGKLVPQTLILLTFHSYDNATNEDVHGLRSIATELRDNNIQLIIIGQGERESNPFLQDVTGNEEQVIPFKSLKRLSDKVFLEKICESIQASVV